VALELWRAINSWTQAGLGRFGLSFLKTKDGAEVDFLITQADKPFLLVETKLSDDNISKAMMMFQNKLMVPAVQLVNSDNVFRQFKNEQHDVLIISAHRWLSTLP
jgi:CO dehydrogenase/acetyl-CoA synthase epsilon subunit